MKTHHFTNTEIARILSEMALLYEVDGVKYKPRAYQRAVQGIHARTEDVYDTYERGGTDALEDIDDVGKAIAGHIAELLTTGELHELATLREKVPVDVRALSSVEGVGPQTIKTLYDELGVKTLDELEEAVHKEKIRALKGFGVKTEENIAQGIAFVRSTSGRFLRGHVASDVAELCDTIRALSSVQKVEVAGSFRRGTETVGDIDIVCSADAPAEVMHAITQLPQVAHVYGSGDTKTHVRLVSDIDVDVRIVPRESWGAAVQYFTGSQAHNIELRKRAKQKGWKLNEYGLYDADGTMVAGEQEEGVYRALDMEYIPPELREQTGEIEAAQAGTLPELIGYDDLKGDMQMHTEWSDGRGTIEERARYAVEMGYEYIAITDHTQSLRMTGGLDEERLRKQMAEITDVNAKLADEGLIFRVLAGAEVNIMKDGSFDVDDDVLYELDVVGVALHSYFDLDRDVQTARVVRALSHPATNIMNHPLARMINKRTGVDVDFDVVMETARVHQVALEIDAPPERLDLPDTYVRRCVEEGVMVVIDSDAHSHKGLRSIVHGITNARRGWATRDHVLNTRSCEDVLAWFRGK